MLWHRLDGEGTDACRVTANADVRLIEGVAAFVEAGIVHALSYRVEIADDWTSRAAYVRGFAGERDVDLAIARVGGGWSVNGMPGAGLDGLADIDLGFTPATNLNAIRRLDLAIGDGAATTAVWLDTLDWQVKPLVQTYRRAGARAYDYQSPAHGYRAELETDDFGMVVHYPGLWRAIG